MKLALITPSFKRDLERCRLLCNSVDKYLPQTIQHFLLVNLIDVPLFKSMVTERRDILIAEEILPKWLFKIPFSRKWWFSLKSYPVRNWILQQILKLSISEFVDSDVYMFVDSDVVIIRPLKVETFIREGKVRLYRVPGDCRIEPHMSWHRNAAKILGLDVRDYFGSNYIGQIISWFRPNVNDMLHRIEDIHQKHWFVILCNTLHFSEYILYGIYADFVAGEKANHFAESNKLCHCFWPSKINSPNDIEKFLLHIKDERIRFCPDVAFILDAHRPTHGIPEELASMRADSNLYVIIAIS